MKSLRPARSTLALKAALDMIGPCHPDTALLVMLNACANNMSERVGNEKASELLYRLADDIATGGTA